MATIEAATSPAAEPDSVRPISPVNTTVPAAIHTLAMRAASTNRSSGASNTDRIAPLISARRYAKNDAAVIIQKTRPG